MYPGNLEELGEYLLKVRSDSLLSVSVGNGELNARTTRAHIVSLVEFLKQDAQCQFTTLIDITAIDFPGRGPRFEVVYHMLSMPLNNRIRIKASVDEGDAVPSIISLFPCANWFEREVFDMYGILFTGHPDLRRILTDYGFTGHPLRKDFPLTGYSEVKYDEVQKKVVYEPVELVQEFRNFDFVSPWEGVGEVIEQQKERQADS